MPTVKDYMTKNVVSVIKNTPIYDVLELMSKNNITGIPVIEDDMTVIGIVTEKDVLKLFYADDDEQNKMVDFFMTQPAVSFKVNDSLESVCDCLMTEDFRRVPVVSSEGKLVGIISRPDIINYIILQKLKGKPKHSEAKLTSPAK